MLDMFQRQSSNAKKCHPSRWDVKQFASLMPSSPRYPKYLSVPGMHFGVTCFLAIPTRIKTLGDNYVEYIMALAACQPIDASLFVDGRINNNRGGRGIGATKYDDFRMACKEVLLPNSATEKRRHSDTVYASGAHSIPNLVTLATIIL